MVTVRRGGGRGCQDRRCWARDLGGLQDIERQGHDLATMTYEWHVGDSSGTFVDAAYPAVVPDTVDQLEETLMQLEEAAGEP